MLFNSSAIFPTPAHHLRNTEQPLEFSIRGSGIAYPQNKSISWNNLPEQIFHEPFKFFIRHALFQKGHCRHPAVDAYLSLEGFSYFADRYFRHWLGANGFGDVRATLCDQIQKTLVFPLAVANQQLPPRMKHISQLLQVGNNIIFLGIPTYRTCRYFNTIFDGSHKAIWGKIMTKAIPISCKTTK